MKSWLEVVVTIICSVLASSGLWAYLMKKIEKKDLKTKVLIGLAHDRILYLEMSYIDRGYITEDEYENLYDYLYLPYIKMGGDGSVERMMDEVKKLPIKKLNLSRKEG